MKSIIIWGASGHAKVISSALGRDEYKIVALIDQNPNIKKFYDFEVFVSIEKLFQTKEIDLKGDVFFIIAIGGNKGEERIKIHQNLIKLGLKPLTFIHPNAWVDPSAQIGAGTQVLAMAAISADVIVGCQTIINTNATVDHETTIGNGCHIMPSATITGCCKIEDFCTIGANATILPRLTLNQNTCVGAGAVVTKNTNQDTTVVGVPAREV